MFQPREGAPSHTRVRLGRRGERITLRPITIDDLTDCTRWAQDAEVMRHVLQATKTPEEEREWLEGVLGNVHEKVFIILNELQKPIGNCAIHLQSIDAALHEEEGLSLGIMIGEKSEWSKGYGSEVIRLLADTAHTEYRTNRVWLTVDSIHARAIRAYEKAGFVRVREFTVADRVHSDDKQVLMEIRYEKKS